MNQGWSRWQSVAIVGGAAAAALLLLITGDRSLDNLALVVLSLAAAAAVAWLAPSKPVVAFGILFLVASLSGMTISTRLGNMRIEQPAIVAGYAALLVTPSRLDLRRLWRFWPIGAAFGVYLTCLSLSSVFVSLDRADSLRMTFWTGLSMSGGVLAFLLLARSSPRATDWILEAGYLQAIVGIVCAVLFFTLGPVLLAGPQPAPGISLPVSSIPKVISLSWEANIFASFLAAVTLLGLNRFLSGVRRADMILVPLMAGAIALGVTRGAYIGFAAGFAVYVLFVATPRLSWLRETLRRVGPRGAVIAASVLVGVALAAVLMQGGRPPNQPFNLSNLFDGGVAAAPGAKPAPTPFYQAPPPPDTVTFRLERIPEALADVPKSPLIGLGANSFGQRHADPSQNGAPDHIAVLALAALYESGVLGAAGLGIGFLLLLLAMFKATRRRPDKGLIAAYAGALVSLLVAYEATNALNFALIWLIAGAGLAVAAEPPTSEPESAQLPA